MSKTDVRELLENVSREDSTIGENYYARKFKSCYQIVRKSLVIINKNRKGENQEAVEMAKEVLSKALASLE